MELRREEEGQVVNLDVRSRCVSLPLRRATLDECVRKDDLNCSGLLPKVFIIWSLVKILRLEIITYLQESIL